MLLLWKMHVDLLVLPFLQPNDFNEFKFFVRILEKYVGFFFHP